MKKKEWNEGLNHIDPDLVEKYVEQKNRLKQKNKKPKGVWLRFGAIAACFCLVIVSAIIVVPRLREDNPGVIPGPGTDIGKETGEEYVTEDTPDTGRDIHDLLNRNDFANIIWGTSGDNTSSNKDPNQSGGGTNVDRREDDTWVEWNDIKISTALRDAFVQLKIDEIIAISVKSVGNPECKLDDYVYNGKTYTEILNDYHLASNSKKSLVALKRFSTLYDKWENKDDEEFWDKLYNAVDEEIVSAYFEGEKKNGRFNTTAISDDLNAYETEVLQLENDLSACKLEYNAKYNSVLLLSKLVNKGYYVVGNDGVYVVILPIGNLVQFSEDVKAIYENNALQNVVFKIASRSDLGIEHNTPTDNIVPGGVNEPLDEQPVEDAIVPGGVNEPLDEQPVEDNVSIE